MNKNKLTTLLFFAGLFLFFLLPPTDPDLGWQLRCGGLIWQAHSLCSQNQFTALLKGYHWPNHHWLYQTILHPLYQLGGFWGLSIFGAVVVTLAFLFFYLSIQNFQLEKIAAILVVIYLSWGVFSFGIRSQLAGFLFFNLMLWIFLKIKKEPKLTWLLPVIMLLWANTHGSFVLGVVLLTFWGLQEITITLYLNPANKKQRLLTTLVVWGLSLGATLANPFRLAIYGEALRHVAGPINLGQLIAEWVPPNPNAWWLILVSGLTLFFYLLLTSTKEHLFFTFLLPAFLLLALSARRHVLFFSSIFFYLLLSSAHFKNLTKPWRRQFNLRKNLALLISTPLLLMATAFKLPRTIAVNHSFASYCQTSRLNYPCKAIQFLRRQKNKGAIFNRYEWGGFLLWQLPEQKIFVDGRMPAWPAFTKTAAGNIVSPYTIYLETLQTKPGWQKTLADYKINWILISPGTFLDLKLKNNPESFGWQEALRSSTFVLYEKAL